MASGKPEKEKKQNSVLTSEQDAVLDLYIKNLDNFFEQIKESEKVQVEIETLHLKKILTK
jgi:hypothetical protein